MFREALMVGGVIIIWSLPPIKWEVEHFETILRNVWISPKQKQDIIY